MCATILPLLKHILVNPRYDRSHPRICASSTPAYGKVRALHGINIRVELGEVVALIGVNGAGKSATLRAISGLLSPAAVDILFNGALIARRRPDVIVRGGIAHCLEERHVWPDLSERENIALGAYVCRDHAEVGTRLCVPDPEHSVFYEVYKTGNMGLTCTHSSLIEGIGRPRVEPSFVPNVVDRMLKIPDAASLATMRVLSKLLGRRIGGSTGTNFAASCVLLRHMKEQRTRGSLVSLICDGGDRYLQSIMMMDGWKHRIWMLCNTSK